MVPDWAVHWVGVGRSVTTLTVGFVVIPTVNDTTVALSTPSLANFILIFTRAIIFLYFFNSIF